MALLITPITGTSSHWRKMSYTIVTISARSARAISAYSNFATGQKQVVDFYGAPGVIRTPDLLVRSQTLYPTELRARELIIASIGGTDQ
jgi:hypothetical protein